MNTNRIACVYGGMALMVILCSPTAEAQKAYSTANGQCSIHNACWQALKIPHSTTGPTGSLADRLAACKAAVGPNKYLGRRVTGLRPCP